MRMLGQNIGEPRRGAEDERDEADELRVLPQQREKTAAGAQAGQEPIESGKSRVRILRARELIDDDRDELGEIFPRLLAAQGAIGRRVPALHGSRDFARLAKANFRQAIERLASGIAVARRKR